MKNITEIVTMILKGRKYSIGHVSTHEDGTKWRKIGEPSKWEPVKGGAKAKKTTKATGKGNILGKVKSLRDREIDDLLYEPCKLSQKEYVALYKESFRRDYKQKGVQSRAYGKAIKAGNGNLENGLKKWHKEQVMEASQRKKDVPKDRYEEYPELIKQRDKASEYGGSYKPLKPGQGKMVSVHGEYGSSLVAIMRTAGSGWDYYLVGDSDLVCRDINKLLKKEKLDPKNIKNGDTLTAPGLHGSAVVFTNQEKAWRAYNKKASDIKRNYSKEETIGKSISDTIMAIMAGKGRYPGAKRQGIQKAVEMILKGKTPVKNPGSRGGKYWIDYEGKIRYGDKPADEHEISSGFAKILPGILKKAKNSPKPSDVILDMCLDYEEKGKYLQSIALARSAYAKNLISSIACRTTIADNQFKMKPKKAQRIIARQRTKSQSAKNREYDLHFEEKTQ